jgi:hypothetical protein
VKKNPDLKDDRATAVPVGERKAYEAPNIVHEAQMETRAGSPLFAGDPSTNRNPWDPDYGADSSQ